MTTFESGIGNVGFRMGLPQRRLGGAFEGACRVSQNSPCVPQLQRKHPVGLGPTKVHYRLHKKEEITYDLANQI
jgi:hypothetical protein